MSPTERIILGHKAWRLAARLLQGRCQRLRHRLGTQDQTPGRILAAEVERLQSEQDCQMRGGRRRCHRDRARRIRDRDTIDRLRTWAARWKDAAHRYRTRSRRLRMRFLSSLLGKVEAENEVERLQAALDSANERCNRIQADGNALAEELHAWRQACQDHGIQPTPEALRTVLRRVDAGCVAEADL